MKSKKLRIFNIIYICVFSCVVFIASGYFYLESNITRTENNVSEVPYSAPVPDNVGILFDIIGSKTYFFLDFKAGHLSVIIPEDEDEPDSLYLYGYPVNYCISSDYGLVADIIDNIGGIDMTLGGETLRYTGVQVEDLLFSTVDNSELKREIITAALAKIGDYGFDRKILISIIENSETELTVPDCYFWPDYMSKLCRGGSFIN